MINKCCPRVPSTTPETLSFPSCLDSCCRFSRLPFEPSPPPSQPRLAPLLPAPYSLGRVTQSWSLLRSLLLVSDPHLYVPSLYIPSTCPAICADLPDFVLLIPDQLNSSLLFLLSSLLLSLLLLLWPGINHSAPQNTRRTPHNGHSHHCLPKADFCRRRTP